MNIDTRKRIKTLIWLYFWLLIVEGALRKWFFPSLSSPLLLVRDPVALYAICLGWPLLASSTWIKWIQPLFLIGVLSLFLALTIGHGDIFVAFYGARLFFLQLPLLFLFPLVFDKQDIVRFCWVLVLISIPMTLLLVLQSNAPATHILNVAPGGEGTAAFDGALGRTRPPGTFSFITGVVSFYCQAAAAFFILLYCTRPKLPARVILGISGVALALALPVSISRSLLAGYVIVIASVIVAFLLARSNISSLLYGLLGIFLSILLATNLPIFQVTSEAFLERWGLAGASTGADRTRDGDLGVAIDQISDRILPSITGPLSNLDSLPFFGLGVGYSSNVAAQRFVGKLTFLAGEYSYEATLLELGYPLGLFFIFWRILLGLVLLKVAFNHAIKGNLIPLILSSVSIGVLMQGQIAQPTAVGFLVFSVGLTLVSIKPPSQTILS